MRDKYADLTLCRPPHLLCWRILRNEFRIFRFNLFQPLHKHIEVIIRNIGRILIIVLLGIRSDFSPQFIQFRLNFFDVAHTALTASKWVHISARIS